MHKILMTLMLAALVGCSSASPKSASPKPVATHALVVAPTRMTVEAPAGLSESQYMATIGTPKKDSVIGASGQPITNDTGMTPGATLTTDKDTICTQHTGTIRNVPIVEKKAVYDAYQKAYPQVVYKRGSYEVDHLISLELGGSNDIKNLWPEVYGDTWGAHVKDKLENYLHAQICNGSMTPTQAQDAIRTNWVTTYKAKIGDPTDTKWEYHGDALAPTLDGDKD